MARAADLTEAAMKAHNTLGIVARYRGRFETAAEHLNAAIALARDLGAWGRVASYLNNLAVTTLSLGRYSEAVDAAKVALSLHRATNDFFGVVSDDPHRPERNGL